MAEYAQGELTSLWKGMVRGMAPEQLVFTALGKRDGRRSEEANPDRNGGRTSEPVVSAPWSHPHCSLSHSRILLKLRLFQTVSVPLN